MFFHHIALYLGNVLLKSCLAFLILQRRLDSMLYVGLTEEHRESASLFANVVGSQVLSQVVPPNATAKTKTTKSGWCKFLIFQFSLYHSVLSEENLAT